MKGNQPGGQPAGLGPRVAVACMCGRWRPGRRSTRNSINQAAINSLSKRVCCWSSPVTIRRGSSERGRRSSSMRTDGHLCDDGKSEGLHVGGGAVHAARVVPAVQAAVQAQFRQRLQTRAEGADVHVAGGAIQAVTLEQLVMGGGWEADPGNLQQQHAFPPLHQPPPSTPCQLRLLACSRPAHPPLHPPDDEVPPD